MKKTVHKTVKCYRCGKKGHKRYEKLALLEIKHYGECSTLTLKVEGKVETNGGSVIDAYFYVIEGKGVPILGKETS